MFGNIESVVPGNGRRSTYKLVAMTTLQIIYLHTIYLPMNGLVGEVKKWGVCCRYPLATFRSREAKYVMVAWKPLLWRPTPFLLVSRTATAVVIPEIFKLLGAKWKVNSKYRKHCLHTCQPKLIFKQEKNKLKNFFSELFFNYSRTKLYICCLKMFLYFILRQSFYKMA